MPRNKRLHFKDINALKAIAYLPIYIYCILFLINTPEKGMLYDSIMILQRITYGSLDLFFFIAAFLATSHGLREYKYLEKFSFKNFIIRRILRLSAVLILALSFAYFVHPWLIEVLDLKMPGLNFPSIEPYLLLVPNYFSEFYGDQLLYLKVIGTIYMFIQFFIVWGLVMRYFKNYLNYIALGLISIGVIARIVHVIGETSFYLDTFSFGVPLGFGALTAYAVRNETDVFNKIKELSKRTIFIIYIVGTSLFVVGYILTDSTIWVALLPILLGIFFSFVIIEQTFGKNSVFQFKNFKILTYLGKLSYGFIVYQGIVGVLIVMGVLSLDYQLDSITIVVLIVLVGFVISLIVADVSYKLFEKPLQRFRREFKKV